MTDEKQIQNLYKDYWTGMIQKDEQGLRVLMAEDYYLEHMTGVRQSREEFLAGLMTGTFNYYSAEHDSIDVEIKGGFHYETEAEYKERLMVAEDMELDTSKCRVKADYVALISEAEVIVPAEEEADEGDDTVDDGELPPDLEAEAPVV